MQITETFSKSYLSTLTFASRAYANLERVSHNEVLLRKGKDCKKLVEEILPIAAFLKYFEIPGRQVKCRYFSGNQNYDAIIKVKGNEVRAGFLEDSYFLEVTSAVPSYAHFEREALSLYGSVFGGGSIRPIGSKHKGNYQIVSKAVAEDGDAVVIKASDWIRKCLKDKAHKEKYPEPCILLIQVEPERPLRMNEWTTVVRNVQGSVNREAFVATFVVNAWENVVLKI
jgi:hypothetical protein